MPIILGLLMAVIAGPGLAWVFTMSSSRKGHELRRQKFEAGKGRDPDRGVIGPHRGFGWNALVVGLPFFVLGMALALIGG